MASSASSAALSSVGTSGVSTPAQADAEETGGPGWKPFPLPKKSIPPSIANVIQEGKKIRTFKGAQPRKMARRPPAPSVPRGTTPTDRDVNMSRRAWRAKARCLRRHNAVLSDRMEQLSKPTRRQLICMWRNYAPLLAPEQIYNLQNMLDASDPFKPEQAYEFFITMKKNQKRNAELAASRASRSKNLRALCGDRQFAWARNATIAFARNLQQRLSRPGSYQLEGGMLRLSDIVLSEICKCKPFLRRSSHPKVKFITEMADKIAVWIDEILSESDERMLMMDFDEDDVIQHADEPVIGGFADDFLNMMAGKGGRLLPPKPAYMKFKGDMLDAFKALTDAMYRKGKDNLLKHGSFTQTYKEGADELRQTHNLTATDYSIPLANELSKKLGDLTRGVAVGRLEEPMKDIIDICSKFLAQNAEYNKEKGEAFKYLIKKMRAQPGEILCSKGKVVKNMNEAATDLETAKGLDTDHDDPILAQNIYEPLNKLVQDCPPEMQDEMDKTLDRASKYLAQKIIDDDDRGPAFEKLIETLKKNGGEGFLPGVPNLNNKFEAAHVLEDAPGFAGVTPNPPRVPVMADALHAAVDSSTPADMKDDMNDVIKKSANYLSAYERDRGPAKEILTQMLNKNKDKDAAKRLGKGMTYGESGNQFEKGPVLAPVFPVQDISKEVTSKFDKDVAASTPTELKAAMKGLVKDAGGDLSQDVAMLSGAAGDRYGRNLVAAIAESKGDEQLFKAGPYGMTHAQAADHIRSEGPLEAADPKNSELTQKVSAALTKSVNERVAPATAALLTPTVAQVSGHLANKGAEAAEALQCLMDQMMTKKGEQLARIQGEPTTYEAAVAKIVEAPSLSNNKVDKGVYETVRSKLKELQKTQPAPQHEKVMPGIIDDVSKFLAKHMPESAEEKKALLLNLMKAKGDEVYDQEGIYKMTYADAAHEMSDTPAGISRTPAVDPNKKAEMKEKMNKAIGNFDKTIQAQLQPEIEDHAHHLADISVGRGDGLQKIYDELKKDGSKQLTEYSNATMSSGEAADAIKNAKGFGPRPSPPGQSAKVLSELNKMSFEPDTPTGDKHLPGTKKMVADFLAAEIGKKGGYIPPAGAGGQAGAEGPPLGTDGKPLKPGQGPGHWGPDGSWHPDGGGGHFDKDGNWISDGAGGQAGAAGPPLGPDGKPLKPGQGPGHRGPDGSWYPEGGGGHFDKDGKWIPDGAAGPPLGPDGKSLKPGQGPGHRGPDGSWYPDGGGGHFDKDGKWIPDGAGGQAGAAGPPLGPDGKPLKPGQEPGHRGPDGSWYPDGGGGNFDKDGKWIPDGAAGPPLGPDGKPLKPGQGPGHRGPDGSWYPDGGGGHFDKDGKWIPDGAGGQAGAAGPPLGPDGKPLKPGQGPGHRGPDGSWYPDGGGGHFDKDGKWIPDGSGPGAGGQAGAAGPPLGPDGKPLKPGQGPGHRGPDGSWYPDGGGGHFDKDGKWIPDGSGPGAGGQAGAAGPPLGPDGKPLKPGQGPGHRGSDGGWYPDGGGGHFDKDGKWIPDGSGPGAGGQAGAAGPPLGPDGKPLKPGQGPGHRGPDGGWYPDGGGGHFDKDGKWIPDGSGPGAGGQAGAAGPPLGPDGKPLKPGQGPGHRGPDGSWYPDGGGGHFDKDGKWIPDGAGSTAGGGAGGAGGAAGGAGGAAGGAGGAAGGAGGAAGGAGGAAGGGAGSGPGTDAEKEERRRRIAAGEKIIDEEHDSAKKILIDQLRKKGGEIFHKQGQTLTHDEAANVLTKGLGDVDKTVRDCAETDKLARKFERKLNSLVEPVTPEKVKDAMTDVVIESARDLGTHFVGKGLGAAVKEALIDEMQKKDTEILIKKGDNAESYYYAAQRLKKANTLNAPAPEPKTARELARELEDTMKNRGMARKYSNTMKEHIKDASDYLSDKVTKTDAEIDALVDLLTEMEAAGGKMLVEGKIPKSYGNAATYLKGLTSFVDKIKKPNSTLQKEIENKMQKLMSSVPTTTYTPEIRNKVISQQAGLLTSYLQAQGEKTDALKKLLEVMDKIPDMMILRHGPVRKSYFDASELLRGKNTDDLQAAKNPDPVVARKLQLKLTNLIKDTMIESPIMHEVVADVTNYLAVHLLLPKVIKVCKCMKSVFVQCELWCDEILRRVTRPCCTCSQSRLLESQPMKSSAVELTIKECPSKAMRSSDKPIPPCPSTNRPCGSVADSATYYVFTAPHCESLHHTAHREQPLSHDRSQLLTRHVSLSQEPSSSSRDRHPFCHGNPTRLSPSVLFSADPINEPEKDRYGTDNPSTDSLSTSSETWSINSRVQTPSSQVVDISYESALTTHGKKQYTPFSQRPITMYYTVTPDSKQRRCVSPPRHRATCRSQPPVRGPKSDRSGSSVVSTDQMSDLYAMMVSVMWNVQAWRSWLQETLNRALTSQDIDHNDPPDMGYLKWVAFKKKVTLEALQWRQYNVFSRQLTLRLKDRYKDKEIVSPTRATVMTKSYSECQQEMLDIINMFNKWTIWLIAVLSETEKIQVTSSSQAPIHILCWNHLKQKIEASLQDWIRYNAHLNICWAYKYRKIITAWKQEGPVWVVSACGAVPSGAVTAGHYFGEEIWLARTTHEGDVLPAALVPSKHCCLVYSEGIIHYYNKYQVLCNARVQWVPWRAGGLVQAETRAVCVSAGVYAGRVSYQHHHLVGAVLAPDYLCRVVLHGRTCAFTCFELLVLTPTSAPPPTPPTPTPTSAPAHAS